MKFRKKPVVIDAVQWSGVNLDEVLAFVETKSSIRRKDFVSPTGGRILGGCLIVETLEGEMTANPMDWIICGVKGEIYPCKPDIFAATYDPA